MLQILNKRENIHIYTISCREGRRRRKSQQYLSRFTVGHPAIYLALPPINQPSQKEIIFYE